MAEDYKLEFQDFFNTTKKDKKKLNKQKKYQVTLKNTILHIVEIIKSQAEEEQLNKYNAIDSRVQNTILELEANIKNITDAKKILGNILNKIKELLNSNIKLSNKQLKKIRNQMSEYKDKKSLIESSKGKAELTALLNELNCIADTITVNKENNVDNIINNISVQENYQQMQNDTENECTESKYIDVEHTENEYNKNEYIENYKEENKKEDDFAETEHEEIEQIESSLTESKDVESEEVESKQLVEVATSTNITEKSKKEDEKNTNVLIISERKGKVFLPYFQSDIDCLLAIGKYKTKEEIIEKLYTVPISRYSNPVISRVTEGFELMRKKEKASISESLKYALNLAFERKLHPAVITACRNMDDLEVYLGLLDDKLTFLFDSFEVKFECRPIKAKKREKLEFSEGV